jgi:hypothetical protein
VQTTGLFLWITPAPRPSSGRSSLEMVHWTISFAFGEPLFALKAV